MTCGIRERRLLKSLVPVFLILFAVCNLLIPYLTIDYDQENKYLGVPFRMINDSDIKITAGDSPFFENGIHVNLISALVLHRTRSLYLMRSYHLFYFALAFFIMSFVVFSDYDIKPRWLMLFLVSGLSLWLIIPEGVRYASQSNGMFMGLCCMVLGLFFQYNRRLGVSAILFGIAAASKTQFVSFLLLLVLFRLIVYKSEPILRAILLVLRDVVYFSAFRWVTSCMAFAFGFFESFNEFVNYSFAQLRYWGSRSINVIPHLFSGGVGDASDISQRKYILGAEFSGWGMLAWSLIAFSVLGASYVLMTNVKAAFVEKDNIHAVTIAQSGCFVLSYWIYFFFVFPTPYWYNVFTVIFFNIAFVYFCYIRLYEWIFEKNARYRMVPYLAIVFLSIALYGKLILTWAYAHKGTALVEFSWMW